MEGRDTDVLEIDAASNTGVDNARQLIANASYLPMRSPSKIYIVDEVHMLSTAAFNALLKTMEEPPDHVKFILCTTDAHRVPATVQSRCQRFDFRNIPTPSIAGHLSRVLEQEGAKAEPGLVHALARMGEGSMRDALSILDRLLAGADAGAPLDHALLERLLGLPDSGVLAALVEALAAGDPAAALRHADELLSRGVSVDQTLESLAEALRDLLVLGACGADTPLVDLSAEGRERAAALAPRFDLGGLVHMIALCDSAARASRHSSAPRAVFDALMVRLAMTEQVADAAALLRGSAGAAAPLPAPTARALPPKKNAPPGTEPGSPSRSAAAPPAVAPGAAPRPAVAGLDPAEVWEAVVARAQSSAGLRTLLADLSLVELSAGGATLSAAEAFVASQAQTRAKQIGDIFAEVTGRPVRIQCVHASAEEAPPADAGADESVRDNPLVRQAQSLFGAVVVGVEPDRTDTPD